MESYNFGQDFLGTFRSSSDAIKALWLIVPPVFVVAQTWVILHSPLAHPRLNKTDGQIDKQKSRIN